MKEEQGMIQDSSHNNLDGEPLGGLIQDIDGKLGPAVQLDGVNDLILMPQIYSGENTFSLFIVRLHYCP